MHIDHVGPRHYPHDTHTCPGFGHVEIVHPPGHVERSLDEYLKRKEAERALTPQVDLSKLYPAAKHAQPEAAPSAAGQVQAALSAQSSRLDALEGIVDELESRLAPVLVAEPVTGCSVNKDADKSPCILDQVQVNTDRAQAAYLRIATLLRRLAI